MKEDIQRLITEWETTYEDLKQQTVMYQDPATKDLSRAVLCSGKAVALGQCIVALYGLLPATSESVTPNSDPTLQLAELYQRVVQIVLQVPVTIDEGADVNFEHPDFGKLYIALDPSKPEWMDLVYMIGRYETHTLEDLLRICNGVNLTPWPAVLTVDEGNFMVTASVALFVAAEGRMPDEGLLRAVIGQAMGVLKSASDEFIDQLRAL